MLTEIQRKLIILSNYQSPFVISSLAQTPQLKQKSADISWFKFQMSKSIQKWSK